MHMLKIFPSILRPTFQDRLSKQELETMSWFLIQLKQWIQLQCISANYRVYVCVCVAGWGNRCWNT